MGSTEMVEPGHDLVSEAPRPSATMCVLHQGAGGVEILMVRRGASARFMGGAWVFPGGAVDAADYEPAASGLIGGVTNDELTPWLAAAFREVVEETGIWLTADPFVSPIGGESVFDRAADEGVTFDAGRTAYFANWVTPSMVPVRFDARFFIAALDEKLTPIPDLREIDAAEYVTPAEALRRAEKGEWVVPFPTQRSLRDLAEMHSVDAALEEWRDREVVTIQPRMRVADDGSLEILMPDDPGFVDLDDVPADPETLAEAARKAARKGKRIPEVADDSD